MKKPEEILENSTKCTINEEDDLDIIENFYFNYKDVISAMKEYGKQQYNQGILDTMKNVVELSLLIK